MKTFSAKSSEQATLPYAFDAIEFPELVLGVAGPIGVDLTALLDILERSLREMKYDPKVIKLTVEMVRFPLDTPLPEPERGYFFEVMRKIKYANSLRKQSNDASTLARLALKAIRKERHNLTGDGDKLADRGIAYILLQLKRPEEVELLRKIYGKQFILISAYGSVDSRKKLVETRVRRTASTRSSDHDIHCSADELIETDADEKDENFGQRLRDTFHLADVFVDGIRRTEMEQTIYRFINALFGRNDISPSKAEYGMYAAKSASLRSADLSRQVGAAIFSDEGELITQGCNEVPKAFGGTYWDLEQPDFRDIQMGHDPNETLRRELLRDLFERLTVEHWLSDTALANGGPEEMVDAAISKKRVSHTSEVINGPLAAALVMDLTEYGRVVHAEMCAICDAARLGRALRGATLYCTTFPCHNCAKHILAVGIKKVVYVEPYPKSKVKSLHEHEIEIDKDDPKYVCFVPFLGISPLRYRDIFQKKRRKNSSGNAERWYGGKPRPMIDILAPFYLEVEASEAVKAFGQQPDFPTQSDMKDPSPTS